MTTATSAPSTPAWLDIGDDPFARASEHDCRNHTYADWAAWLTARNVGRTLEEIEDDDGLAGAEYEVWEYSRKRRLQTFDPDEGFVWDQGLGGMNYVGTAPPTWVGVTDTYSPIATPATRPLSIPWASHNAARAPRRQRATNSSSTTSRGDPSSPSDDELALLARQRGPEFAAAVALAAVGLDHRSIATRLGVHPRMVWRWLESGWEERVLQSRETEPDPRGSSWIPAGAIHGRNPDLRRRRWEREVSS